MRPLASHFTGDEQTGQDKDARREKDAAPLARQQLVAGAYSKLLIVWIG